jgi:hypothetical protein
MAGTLEIDNAGSVLGFGGAANGGAGGHAIQNLASGVTINNTGLLAGGGGGGGGGGTGGQGSYTNTTFTYYYSSGAPTYQWLHYWESGGSRGFFNQSQVFYSGNSNASPNSGYYKGPYVNNGPGVERYKIGIANNTTVNTSGGSGGAGGVGQGYTQTNASGSSGAAGGTNAGTGGIGGSGATYGTAGSTGSTGANGNSSNGSGGASGGAAGAAVTGTSVTMNNTGTLAGAVA